MVFGDALERMKAGAQMTRRGWPFPDAVYAEYTPVDLQPYLVVKAGEREAIPYMATDIDIFANDWQVVK